MQEGQVCEQDIVQSCMLVNLFPARFARELFNCPIGVLKTYKMNFEWISLNVNEHIRQYANALC